MEAKARPSKMEYYLMIAEAVAMRSTCLRMKYGCVIVNNDEVVATGYNGNPRGRDNCIDLGFCSKLDKSHNSNPDSYNMCKSVHAEMNAMLSASRAEMIGADMYLVCYDVEAGAWSTDVHPCPICCRIIQNSGIRRLYTCDGYVTVGE